MGEGNEREIKGREGDNGSGRKGGQEACRNGWMKGRKEMSISSCGFVGNGSCGNGGDG